MSEPCVLFSETVIETSSIKCSGESANRENNITILASPLNRGLEVDIQEGFIDINNCEKLLKEKYDWDILASRSVWAFGPELRGSNVLLNDTLPYETNKQMLMESKENII